MALTLNQIKYRLLNFFENHKQVKHVEYLDQYNFAALRNLEFPVVNIEFQQSSIQNKFMVHSWNIFIGDKLKPDNLDSEDEICSDALQIAEDFFSYFRNLWDMDLKQTSNIQTVSDSFGDRVSGIVFNISVNVLRLFNPTVMPSANNLPPVQQYSSYWGWVDTIDAINVIGDITGLQFNGLFVDQGDILADYTANNLPKYLVFAEPTTQPVKRKWYVSTNNNGTIGLNVDDLFKAPVVIDNYRYYITAYKTQQTDGLVIFKNQILN